MRHLKPQKAGSKNIYSDLVKKKNGQTVTFEEIKPAMLKWAKFFCNNRFDIWELINSAWADGTVRFLPKSKIKLASKRIAWDMQEYMRHRDKLMFRRRAAKSQGYELKYINNFSEIGPKDEGFVNLMPTEDSDIDTKDIVDFLTNHPSLSMREKLILKLYFIDDFSNREAGEVCGIKRTRTSQIRINIVERLKALDRDRII